MGSIYKKNVGGRNYQNYKVESLENAVKDVKMGKLSLRVASERYGVPKSTISDKIKEMHSTKMRGQTVLSALEEEKIVCSINTAAEWGFPLSEFDIRLIVQEYLDKKEVNIRQFRDNFPGREWGKSFLTRHKSLTTRFCQNIKRCRAKLIVIV